jgi:hypothetical protein
MAMKLNIFGGAVDNLVRMSVPGIVMRELPNARHVDVRVSEEAQKHLGLQLYLGMWSVQ